VLWAQLGSLRLATLAQGKLLTSKHTKQKAAQGDFFALWAQLGSNQRPPDYESECHYGSIVQGLTLLRIFKNIHCSAYVVQAPKIPDR